MSYASDPVGPPPELCTVGLVARSPAGWHGGEWHRVGGWQGTQPLVWVDGRLQMFNTNAVVEVVYDPALWEAAE